MGGQSSSLRKTNNKVNFSGVTVLANDDSSALPGNNTGQLRDPAPDADDKNPLPRIKSYHIFPPAKDATAEEQWAYRKRVWWQYINQHPYAQLFGKFLAIAYAALCGIGSTAAVNDLFGNPTLALAAGSVGFVVNIAIFWVCVPAMLAKLFSSQYSMYDESFEATINGTKTRIKLRNSNEERVSVERFSARWWMITLFSAIFATAASLTYTGLLMSKLPETLAMFPGLGFLASGGGFLGIAILFFGVSMICNWAFNAYDASEQFSKNDFFAKLKEGILKLFLKPDDTLLLDHEHEKGAIRPNKYVLAARQLVRLGLVGCIAALGYFAITSVSQMGAAGLFAFIGLGGAPAAAVWTLFALSAVGASFFYGMATYRFSTFAAKQFGMLAHLYAQTGKESLPKLLYAVAMVTVAAPVLNILWKGLQALVAIEWKYLNHAFEQPHSQTNPAPVEFKNRVFHDASSCWHALRIEDDAYSEDVTKFLWNWVARPFVTGMVGVSHFVFNNLFGVRHWFMHGMAMINAVVNNGALAYPGGEQETPPATPDNPNPEPLPRPNPYSGEILLAMVGNAQGSAQTYINSVRQKELAEDGQATTTEEAYRATTLIFSKNPDWSTRNSEQPMVDPDIEKELTRRGILVRSA